MKLLVLRPTVNKKPTEQTPGLLWIYGGGYMVGSLGMVYMSRAMALVKKYGAVVVVPQYRLAGKAPYPAALEDCRAALLYLKENAEELGCSPSRLMVGGESAGGGLTAALCMHARDHGGVNIAFQMPLYPMLDDRPTESSRRSTLTWNAPGARFAWRLYLRGTQGEPPPYAVPARQRDYSGLPPAYSFVGRREAFYCETLAYIANLQAAGVTAHVDVYPCGTHGFDIAFPHWRVSRKAIAEFEKQYLYAAEHYTAPQEET
ncbi:MAG: alpha/beta hydrolase [Clostridia bacterium]|nr:alpha/beta hydrolase [Clostridia bacterium]